MKIWIIVTVSLVAFFAKTVFAEGRVAILCIGEYRDQCPPNTTMHDKCGTKAEDLAKDFCTIQTKDGPKIVPHFLDYISQKPGNKCGYNWYKITCKDVGGSLVEP